MNTNKEGKNSIADAIVAAMKAQVERHGLQLMRHYPADLLVHDRATLEKAAVPGAQIAWMCGHSHTHIVILGLHPDENMHVDYLLNLANDDKFYKLTVGNGETFSLKEITREAFGKLNQTSVAYQREGKLPGFWLTRKNKERVGFISCALTGTYENKVVSVTITPIAGISELDISALLLWASHSAVETAHSLFVRSEVIWAEPLLVAKAA